MEGAGRVGVVTLLAVALGAVGCGKVIPASEGDGQTPATLPATVADGDAGADAKPTEVAFVSDAGAAEGVPDVPAAEVMPDAGAERAPDVIAPACSIVINEIQTGGQTATDEFVELFNTCAERAVPLAGYKLVYRSDTGTSDIARITFTTETIVAGHPYFVCANDAFAGLADARYTDGLRAEGGGLALRGPDGKIVDAVGWGTATNALVETAAAAAPPAGQSIAREPDGRDTNDNAKDFVVKGAVTSPGVSNGAP